MPNRIEIALKEGVRDARGERIKREIEHFLHLPVDEVRTIDVYTVDAALSPGELEQAASGPFSDPVIQAWSIDRPLAAGFDYAVEVGFRPGVTDNVGRTAREAVAYLTDRPFVDGEGVYYAGTARRNRHLRHRQRDDRSGRPPPRVPSGRHCRSHRGENRPPRHNRNLRPR